MIELLSAAVRDAAIAPKMREQLMPLGHTQLPLALAFVTAKVGDLETAERELDKYLARDSLMESEVKKLRRLVRESASSP